MHEQLGRAIDHLEWADARTLASLRGTSPPPADAVRLMAHIAAAEHVWVSRLVGRAPRVAVWPELSVEESAELARETVGELRRLLASWSERDLAEDVAYRNSAGDEFRSRRDDIVMHVAMHGMYHRGQVALLVRRAGQEPNATDYIAFVRGAPAARTPLTATSAPRRSS